MWGINWKDLHLLPQNIVMFPYSIVTGDYYSGDARYLAVNDYSMLQITIGYKLVVGYARHGYLFSADCSGSVPLPDRSFAACASMHMRSGMRPVAFLFPGTYTETGQTRAATFHRIE